MNLIAKNFGKASFNYEKNADIQKNCAKALVKLLPNNIDIKSFIDIGAGTGFASIELLKIFKNAKITLLDISDKMLKIAKLNIPDARIINFNAEHFSFKKNNFDFAVSNLSCQWFVDFEKFFKNIMNGCRYFLFSTIGEKSFDEYKKIFEERGLNSPTFPYDFNKPSLYDITKNIAKIISYKEVVFEKHFLNAISVAKYFKGIGANLSSGKIEQSKIVSILKSYKKPITLRYNIILCFIESEIC